MDTKHCDTLYDYHMECLTSFYRLITPIDSMASTSTVNQQSLDEFQENLNKYKVWAGNVGAGNRGEYWTLSLDFRLQEAAFLRSQVIRLIESLTRTVKKARSLLDGTRIPFDQSELFIPLSESAEPYDTEASGDDSPWEVSDDSSNSGCGADDPSDMNQKDYPHDVARNNIRAPTTEMGQLLKSTMLIIECLYKLPLRKPAPIDRVKRFRGRDVSLYQHFDVLYVRDKFPHAENYLVERLGKLISRRRQLLEYRVTHTERLQPPMSSQIKAGGHQLGIPDRSLNDSSSQVTGTQNRKSAIRDLSLLGQSFDDSPSTITKATVQSPAEAVTTLDLLYPPSVTESRMSTSSEYTENHKLEIPPRPVNESGEPLVHFECPYCGLAKSIKIEPSRAWESHVLRDLEPYVCTFQDCDMFDHMFDSRQAWFAHESELHRAKWSCNACPSEMDTTSAYLTFETKDTFTSHMSLVHKLPKHKLDRLSEPFRHPNTRVDGYCCLCGKHAQKLKAHLGRHMEVIALFALPRPSLQESGDSGKALADPCHGSSKGLPARQDVVYPVDFSAEERVAYERIKQETIVRIDEALGQEAGTQKSRGYVNVLQQIESLRLFSNLGLYYQSRHEKASTQETEAEEWNQMAQKTFNSERVMGSITCFQCASAFSLADTLLDDMSTKAGAAQYTICFKYICSDCVDRLRDLGQTLPCGHTPPCQSAPVSTSNIALEEIDDPAPPQLRIAAVAPPSKIRSLVDSIKLTSPETKCVVFSTWRLTLDLVKVVLDQEGIQSIRFDGKVPQKDRQSVVERFESDPNVRIMLLTLNCGAVGLTLTAACRAYLIEPHWNPTLEEQALACIHRLGQTKNVTTIRLYMRDSFEEQVMKVQESKKQLADVLSPHDSGYTDDNLGALKRLRSLL